ncbi:MAG: hypothetical protein HYW26_01755 [Candidatus Aenigmarchaeota archaeon]|nr:hypothetical protein [Candidatus Aenigmarchaeota archaeon]
MVFHKILSFADMVAAAIIILYLVKFLPLALVKDVAFYLIIKGAVFLLFSRDFASSVDVVFGIYLLILASGIYTSNFITILAAVWLLQKSVFGLM